MLLNHTRIRHAMGPQGFTSVESGPCTTSTLEDSSPSRYYAVSKVDNYITYACKLFPRAAVTYSESWYTYVTPSHPALFVLIAYILFYFRQYVTIVTYAQFPASS